MRQVERAYGDIDIARTGSRQDLAVSVDSGEAGERLGWSVAQFVVAHGARLHPETVAFADKRWRTGRDSEKGWAPGGQADKTAVQISMG
jgi:hypothetical protein